MIDNGVLHRILDDGSGTGWTPGTSAVQADPIGQVHGPFASPVAQAFKTFTLAEAHDRVRLKMRLYALGAAANDVFTVKLDNNVVWSATRIGAGCGNGWSTLAATFTGATDNWYNSQTNKK